MYVDMYMYIYIFMKKMCMYFFYVYMYDFNKRMIDFIYDKEFILFIIQKQLKWIFKLGFFDDLFIL